MTSRSVVGLAAAAAVVGLMAMPAAQAQIYGPAPMAPPIYAPGPMVPQAYGPGPMESSEVDFYSDSPKAEPGDFNWSARQNVVESERYEQLVHTDPAFRAARIRKECGSFIEPDAYQQCVASFY